MIEYVYAIILLTTLDAIWISCNFSRYNRLITNVQGNPIKMNIIPAALAYACMYIGLALCVLPHAKRDVGKSKLFRAMRHGALFGLVTYGIYNATNGAILSNYDTMTGIMDTCWGTFAYFFVTWIFLVFTEHNGV